MFIIDKCEYPRFIPWFDRFVNDRSVVFSVLSGQFDGALYVDAREHPHWVFLFTPFAMHYVSGSPASVREDAVESFLFETILGLQAEKELILYAADRSWDAVLHPIFTRRNGTLGARRHFEFSPENYRGVLRQPLRTPAEIRLRKAKWIPFSHDETWGAEVLVDGSVVSSCQAIMIGDGLAELSVDTDEMHRNKGYATAAAFHLIDQLLKDGIRPCWATWPHRAASQRVADKLGFVRIQDEPAWIWFERR